MAIVPRFDECLLAARGIQHSRRNAQPASDGPTAQNTAANESHDSNCHPKGTGFELDPNEGVPTAGKHWYKPPDVVPTPIPEKPTIKAAAMMSTETTATRSARRARATSAGLTRAVHRPAGSGRHTLTTLQRMENGVRTNWRMRARSSGGSSFACAATLFIEVPSSIREFRGRSQINRQRWHRSLRPSFATRLQSKRP